MAENDTKFWVYTQMSHSMELNECKHKPTVSVVMPVYNVAPYVERCILSVMRQSLPATECIIVDDASEDDSIERCKRLIDGYAGSTRFLILHHCINRGLSAARNTGTDAATSKYIYYVDSDDEMTSDCLEKLVAPVMHDETIEMVLGNYRMDFSALSGLRHRLKDCNTVFMQDTPAELTSNEELRRWFYKGRVRRTDTVWNKLLNLSFIRANKLYNKEGLLFCEDQLWSYYLMRCLNHAAFIHDVTYLHFFRPGSIVTATKKEDNIKYMGYIYREIADHIIPGERIDEVEHWLCSFCNHYIEASESPDYQYAYKAFLNQLSDGHHQKDVNYLKFINCLSRHQYGRLGSKSIMRAVHLTNKGYSTSLFLIKKLLNIDSIHY